MPTIYPYIPRNITVHLGPPDSNAQNVTVPFIDYIKNVASSEIYPTWNESAIIANVYAQISYTLNRVYTEYYVSRGYNFQITNSTAIDQKFIYGRNIFENIDRIVNNIFNDYLRRQGTVEPLAAKYCDGIRVTCEGLSQWGSESLANQGYNSMDIIYNYYGYDVELVVDAPIQDITESYPGYPLRRGSTGPEVAIIQTELNRISRNYPAIPKVYPVDGIFGSNTENAVIRFQEIFNLAVDGIVGKETWYKLVFLYVGITELNELDSEGQRLFGISLEYPDAISYGDRGEKVSILQYFLLVIATFDSRIPPVAVTGEFGDETKNAVMQFQRAHNIDETGVVGDITWNALYEQFMGIVDTVFLAGGSFAVQTMPFPGTLQYGDSGEGVRTLQQYLNLISTVMSSIQPVEVTGYFGPKTRQAVITYQGLQGFEQTGIVDKQTWDSIANSYHNAISPTLTHPMQYPGQTLRAGDQDAG